MVTTAPRVSTGKLDEILMGFLCQIMQHHRGYLDQVGRYCSKSRDRRSERKASIRLATSSSEKTLRAATSSNTSPRGWCSLSTLLPSSRQVGLNIRVLTLVNPEVVHSAPGSRPIAREPRDVRRPGDPSVRGLTSERRSNSRCSPTPLRRSSSRCEPADWRRRRRCWPASDASRRGRWVRVTPDARGRDIGSQTARGSWFRMNPFRNRFTGYSQTYPT